MLQHLSSGLVEGAIADGDLSPDLFGHSKLNSATRASRMFAACTSLCQGAMDNRLRASKDTPALITLHTPDEESVRVVIGAHLGLEQMFESGFELNFCF